MSRSSCFVVHYGHHEGTTGQHLSQAILRAAVGTDIWALGPREHPDIRDLRNRYLWIESGVPSYPLNTWSADAITAGYLIDVHQHPDVSRLQAMLFDVVFVAQKDFLDELHGVHPDVRWLPLAAPAAFCRLPRDPRFAVGFVGSTRDSVRRGILELVNQHFGMNDWRRSYGVSEMGAVYSQSRVVVNPPVGGDVNMRFFEAMAAGAALVSPLLGNGMLDLCTPAEELFCTDLTDPTLLVDGITAALNRADELGGNARSRVARSHTYDHRAESVLAALYGASHSSPARQMSPDERAAVLMGLASYAKDFHLADAAFRLSPRSAPRLLPALAGIAARRGRAYIPQFPQRSDA